MVLSDGFVRAAAKMVQPIAGAACTVTAQGI
jgi:hypothetical protein